MIAVKTIIDTHCKLKNLIIKPTLKCNGNCSFCSQRLNHYKENHASRDLSFERWLKILDEAASLGVRVVNISGGEPTLYKYLVDLVMASTKRSLEVNLKTNGFLINDKLIKDLYDAGLNSCTISIYSHNPKIHNRIKRIKGSHNVSVEAIKKLKNAEDTDIRNYAKYILKEGSVSEKRELLANLRSRLSYKDKRITLIEA